MFFPLLKKNKAQKNVIEFTFLFSNEKTFNHVFFFLSTLIFFFQL